MTAHGTAILGGGALGLTLAYRLAAAGERVEVIEREREAGGLAAGFRLDADGPWLEKFYHHIFGTDTALVALIQELGLADRLFWGTPNSSILIGGKPYELAGNVGAMLALTPLPLRDRLRMGAAGAFLKVLPDPGVLEGQTAAAWLRRWMGPRAYDVIWEPQLRGKFGMYAGKVAMPWMWARVHYRTSALGYLRGGFQQLYEALARGITAHGDGGVIRLGTEVRAVSRAADGTFRVATSSGEGIFSRVVSTLPSRLTFKLVEGLPADFRARYDWGSAFGAHCLILALDRHRRCRLPISRRRRAHQLHPRRGVWRTPPALPRQLSADGPSDDARRTRRRAAKLPAGPAPAESRLFAAVDHAALGLRRAVCATHRHDRV